MGSVGPRKTWQMILPVDSDLFTKSNKSLPSVLVCQEGISKIGLFFQRSETTSYVQMAKTYVAPRPQVLSGITIQRNKMTITRTCRLVEGIRELGFPPELL
jgi:hypothetical protein